MAQRYGRKRRRAHLAEIERQSQQIEKLTAVGSEYRADAMRNEARYERLLAEMQDWDYDVRSLLGPYSALAFRLADLPYRGHSSDVRRLPVPAPLRAPQTEDIGALPPDTIVERIAYLRHMLFNVVDENHLQELRTYLRLRITSTQLPPAEAVYAFSEAYWAHFRGPLSRRDIAYLAADVAKMLLTKAGEPSKKIDLGAQHAARRE